ncbi:hypothetical protein Pla163_23480 [Planctomycetes bacterium Pla163]|uniref:Uncharacterized protein n=1 Tax=Rohdeia mirabilis TaxID=2528008 RepID=A0A518D185_9BACT|nr:hypothetical protein Pla163_23480 [Planctomycetes bacterium Pla163]
MRRRDLLSLALLGATAFTALGCATGGLPLAGQRTAGCCGLEGVSVKALGME